MNHQENESKGSTGAQQAGVDNAQPTGSLRPEAPCGEEEEKGFFKVIVHSFFVIPFLIAVFCVLLFTAIHLLTREQRSAEDYLADIKTGGLTKRWQGAFELSKILANPKLVPANDRFFSELIDAFEHAKYDDDRIRQYLAFAMGRIANPVFSQPLLNGLKEEKESNLPAVIYALGMLRQKEAVPALYPYLDHPQARIRSITVVALGNIADARSDSALRKALADPEPNVQWGAAVSLAKMGDAAGKSVLMNMLDRGYLAKFPEVDAEEQNNLLLLAINAAAPLRDVNLDERIAQLAKGDKNMTVRSAARDVTKR